MLKDEEELNEAIEDGGVRYNLLLQDQSAKESLYVLRTYLVSLRW